MTDPYPADPCPFCNIAAAYPFPESPLWEGKKAELGRCVPREEELDVERTTPSSFVVLRSRDVVAFLDILPMVGGMYNLHWDLGVERFCRALISCLCPSRLMVK